MQDRTIYALAAVGCLFAATWILLAPAIGLPFGVTASTGPSMDNDGMMFNVYIDAEPQVGDVVIYDQHGQLSSDRIVHRVVDETDQGYVTKGDANPYTDQSVKGVAHLTDENMIGVVVVRTSITIPICLLSVVIGFVGVVDYLGMAKPEIPIQ